jgi:hypothetical protein
MKIALLPGDGIGPEILAEAIKVLKGLDEQFEFEEAPLVNWSGASIPKRVTEIGILFFEVAVEMYAIEHRLKSLRWRAVAELAVAVQKSLEYGLKDPIRAVRSN